MKHWILALTALLLMLARVTRVPAYAQTADQNQSDDADNSDDQPSCAQPQTATYAANVDKAGFGFVFFSICVDPARESVVRKEIERSLNCGKAESDIKSFQSDGLVGLEAICEFSLSRDGLRFSGAFDLPSIQNILKSSGEDRSLELIVSLPDHGNAGCEPSSHEEHRSSEILMCRYSFTSKETDPAEIRFSFGFTTAETLRIGGVLGFLLILPIAATLWLRQRAQRASEEERQAVWFAYFRLFRLTVIVGALVWWAAIDLLGADDLLAYLLPNEVNSAGALSILPWVLLWFAAATVYMLCIVLSTPIHRLRGIETTRIEAIRRAFWGVARIFIPYVLLVLALSELAEAPRISVMLFAAVFVVTAFTTRRLLSAYGMEFHAITSGNLRDRAFVLAQKAGTKLHQLYMIPAEKMRMANAFAHFRRNIYLTDYLLKNLSKREVDAVVGHELTHLRQKHIGKRIQVFVTCMGAGVVGAYLAGEKVSTRFPAGPLLIGVILLAVLFLTRRNEYAADAGSAQLTGDAEAMITALAKLSRLNTMPMRWGRIEEKILTHPSIERRVLRLARSARIAETRVEALVRESANPPADVYAIDPTSLPRDKVFSTRFKNTVATRLAWTILLTGAGIPAAVAWFVQRVGLTGPVQWAAYGVGLLMTLAACLAETNFLSLIKMRRLEKDLRARAEQHGAPREIAMGVFVGLGLDDEPRIYEHNWSWDIGFLSLSPTQLVYWGETVRFAIGREEIVRIWAGPGPVGWIPTVSAYVSFGSGDGATRTVNFRIARVRSLSEMTRLSRLLTEDLQSWRLGTARADRVAVTIPESSAQAVRLNAPRFGAITSQSARDAAGSGSFARDLLLNGFLAFGAIVLAGLSIRWPNWIEARTCATGPGNAGVFYVLAAAWATRVFMWMPYWRAQDNPAAPATPVIASSPAE